MMKMDTDTYRDEFVYDERSGMYTKFIKGINLEIEEKDYYQESIIKYAFDIIGIYEKKQTDIAKLCFNNANFHNAYPDVKEDMIIQRLHIPIIWVYEDGGLISFCDHDMDDEHIIEIKFKGMLEKFINLSIDG